MSECNRFPRLLRLRDEGDLDGVEAHLAECPACADAWRDLAALTALGQTLPDGRPDEARRESVRTRILAQAQAEARPVRRPGRLVALAAAAAIGAWIIGTQFVADLPAPIGRIASAPGAIFSVRKTEAVEWVALDEGRITIRVPTLPADRRLVVVTDDAEVEVRGTIFTVEALDGRLTAVEVEEGVVEVRPAGADAVRLKASQRWAGAATAALEPAALEPAALEPAAAPTRVEAPAERPRELPSAAPIPPSGPRELPADEARGSNPGANMPAKAPPAPPGTETVGAPAREEGDVGRAPGGTPVAPAGKPADRPEAPTRADAGSPEGVDTAGSPDAALAPDAGPSPQTLRFDEGWRALRAGRPAAAAPAFAAAAALDGPLTADARWWRAVALGRAGDDDGARAAVTDYLKAYPRSARAAEASVMLGWLDFAAGRVDAAEAAFDRGLEGSRPAVRQSAREGLDAVKNWRAAHE